MSAGEFLISAKGVLDMIGATQALLAIITVSVVVAMLKLLK